MSNAQLVRVLQVAKAVEGKPPLRSLTTLAARFRVCTRTIYRDLQALQAAGWAVPPFRYSPRKES